MRPSRRLAVGRRRSRCRRPAPRGGGAAGRRHAGRPLRRATRIAVMAADGEMPLPPYIHDRSTPADRYQTVYAQPPGLGRRADGRPALHARAARRAGGAAACAAHRSRCTSGSTRSAARGRVRRRAPHPSGVVRGSAGDAGRDRRRAGRRVVAVGTTSVRVLETAARNGRRDGLDRPLHHAAASVRRGGRAGHELPPAAQLAAAAGDRLRPGRHGARDAVRSARPAAARPTAMRSTEGYRFFSFGDAMLIR